ncbi:MAG: hypothetical protein HYR66_06570 [Sphingobacteriales bacterium]|nr:hypothetical protein [Sphingobacteriales bacterium]MBI3718305.1 hypothetical protein [Sphingobacteriales bacterium]
MSNNNLNEKEAYMAMLYFLEEYNRRGRSDEIEILLGSMDFYIWADNTPNDPAMWPDLLSAVEKVKANKNDIPFLK